MNWGAWRTTVHVVAKSQTRLSTCVLCGLILNRKSLPAICCPVRSLSLTQAEGAAPLPAVPLSDLQPCLGGHVARCRVPSCNRLPCLSFSPPPPGFLWVLHCLGIYVPVSPRLMTCFSRWSWSKTKPACTSFLFTTGGMQMLWSEEHLHYSNHLIYLYFHLHLWNKGFSEAKSTKLWERLQTQIK